MQGGYFLKSPCQEWFRPEITLQPCVINDNILNKPAGSWS